MGIASTSFDWRGCPVLSTVDVIRELYSLYLIPGTSRPTQRWTECTRIMFGRITDEPEIICPLSVQSKRRVGECCMRKYQSPEFCGRSGLRLGARTMNSWRNSSSRAFMSSCGLRVSIKLWAQSPIRVSFSTEPRTPGRLIRKPGIRELGDQTEEFWNVFCLVDGFSHTPRVHRVKPDVASCRRRLAAVILI